jgi:hypothetical protein
MAKSRDSVRAAQIDKLKGHDFLKCPRGHEFMKDHTVEDWFRPGIGVVWHNAEHHGTPYGNRRELVSYRADS